jgi:hypothetical protein
MSSVDLGQLVGGKSCTVPCHIFNNGSKVSSLALADTGANAFALIDTQRAQRTSQFLAIPIECLPNPIHVRGFDGTSAPPITSILRLHICVDRRRLYNVPFLITDLGGHDVILGRKWMSHLGVHLDVRRRRIVWPQNLPPTPWFAKEIGTTMRDLLQTVQNPIHQEDATRRDQDNTTGEIVTLEPARVCILQRPKVPRPEIRNHTELLDRKNSLRKMEQELQSLTDLARPAKARKRSASYPANLPKVDVCVISAVGFYRNVTQPGAVVFSTTLYEIDRILEEKMTQEDQDYQELVESRLPAQYRDYKDVFSKAAADVLPPNRSYDHQIELEDNPESLGFSLLRRQSTEELLATKKYITEHLSKGFIEPSQAPFAAPILFVRKANGALRLCIDFRKLNSLTRKDRYPLPLIDETLARLGKAKVFTRLDIRGAFHRIRMHPDSEDLTTFRTRYGTYKCKVLWEGLTNGPATYQRYMNDVLFDYLDNFCTAYLDDILIYSSDELEHQEHVCC